VEGEISNLTYHSSGHIYFSIKDKKSSIKAVMWKGNASYLKFRLEHGMKIIIHGAINVYEPRGDYQVIASKVEPSGKGSLALAYEQLKQDLSQKGYFDTSIKKELPLYPKKIAIVTSATSAAIADMRAIAQKRWALIKIIVIDTLTQGESAKYSISKSIKRADKLDVDVIVVGRGGGSIEDLWAFNEIEVADAIYECRTPIVSAVGHEIDFVISDFVADIRASTPSNAMEIILPNIDDILMLISEQSDRFHNTIDSILQNKDRELKNIKEIYIKNSFEQKYSIQKDTIKSQIELFNNSLNIKFHGYNLQIVNLMQSYKSNHPSNKLKDGFAQIISNGKITNLNKLQIDDIISLQDDKTNIKAKVLKKVY